MKSILFIIAFIICCEGRAQINIITSASASGQAPYSKAHRQRLMDELKRSTTIFILQYRDYDQLSDFEKAIKESWKITPYKIIKPQELQEYEGKKGFTFFTFNAIYTGKHHNTQHLQYGLWCPVLNKHGKLKSQFFYSSEVLYPTDSARILMVKYALSRHKYDATLMNDMLDNARYFNWNAQLLKGYLQTTNDFLTRNENLGIWNTYTTEHLKELKTDTLYIPDYVKTREEFWRNRTYQDSSMTDATIFSEYPYPIKFVSMDQLTQMLAANQRNIHYLVYTVDASVKYVDVFSSRDGLLYAFTRLMSWTFKEKDLGHLAGYVE